MIELIPAIDIIDGKCVRLVQGNYEMKTEYAVDPAEVAIQFEEMGIRRLHLVDLDGAREGSVVNLGILEKIAARTKLIIDFGGGIKTGEDIRRVFDSGAEMVTAGSVAVKNPERVSAWLADFGPQKIILGTDVSKGMIAIHGWQEETAIELFDFTRRWMQAGIRKIICTDIALDGMLAGPSVRLYEKLGTAFPGLEIIASGGVSGMKDIYELEGTGVNGVIFGKAYYEGRISRNDIINYLKNS